MKYLFYPGKLKFLTEKEIQELPYQEVFNLCIQTLRYQQKILLQDGKNNVEKLHYGKKVVDALELSIVFVEVFFPDIRRNVKAATQTILRKSN